jgi:hypothetical protein
MLRIADTHADDDTYSFLGPRLEYQLEHCLLFGRGSGGQLVIRHLDVFKREWSLYREEILPKFIDAFPGRRPAAAYIVGELPQRPMGIDIPLDHPARGQRVYVIGDHQDGFWHCDYPEPYQRNESAWLYEIGAIDKAEHVASRGRTRAQ